ncbi:MAG: beta-L-arabinofuranosidase domain-containing protein [Draconibacterium sp.]
MTFNFNKIKRILFAMVVGSFMLTRVAIAQEKLYPNEFPLSDVKLLDGPFKHAQDLNIHVLLEYDIDRLIAPFRKEAGLPEKAKLYPNWAGLDGHVGGHYLSALAMNYASTGNAECKKRMDYMISELKACQDANDKNHPGWGKGYVGGAPNSQQIWSTFQKGDFAAYRAAWVPWYNVHKLYSGLRDAWLYAGNEDAKAIFLKFCDWGINITANLSEEQMQQMLDTEHGGMNEIFADAYQMTGDEKYLVAAKRFSHRMLLDAMAARNDNLDNKHANTQVPKAVGFQRIAELSKDKKYIDAGSFFWETVTGKRSLAFGGNSRREFFPSVASCTDFVNDVEGPETCNSYNMLKLTKDLFRVNPKAKYADYYERTMYNHILSTQHPEHGGYVYFTPARPRHYRVYSQPNEAMWCCVGSGMENHGKYSQFIYTHQNDSLFLNLFVASELNWREKGIKLVQETQFPNEETTRLKITDGAAKFKLMVRYPSWVKAGALKILVNGKPVEFNAKPSSYVAVERNWKKGDEVQILLPMHNTIEKMPNVSNYIAIMHGPILLGAKTGTEDLKGLVADDGRWAHIAGGERLPVDKAPIIIENSLDDIVKKITPVKNKPFTFTASFNTVNNASFELEPFYGIHDSRYMIYWMWLTESQYKNYIDSLAIVEKERMELQKRTIDFVAPGEQQPEADHQMEKQKSSTGNYQDNFWRDARNEGYFTYNMATNSETGLSLMVRYWGAEWGGRKFDIFIDNERLITEDNTGRWNQSQFQEVKYEIPDSMVKDKKQIRVKFQALPGNTAGAVYYIRLVRNKSN